MHRIHINSKKLTGIISKFNNLIFPQNGMSKFFLFNSIKNNNDTFRILQDIWFKIHDLIVQAYIFLIHFIYLLLVYLCGILFCLLLLKFYLKIQVKQDFVFLFEICCFMHVKYLAYLDLCVESQYLFLYVLDCKVQGHVFYYESKSAENFIVSWDFVMR